jgi:hypothetical protein
MPKRISKVLKNVADYVYFHGIGMNSMEIIWGFFSYLINIRSKNVEKSAAYSKTFKGNDDGKVNSSGPRQIVGQNGVGPGSGYVQR